MRIAHVTTHFVPFVTGPGTIAEQMCSILSRRGYDCSVFTTDYGAPDAPALEYFDRTEVHRLKVTRSYMQYLRTPTLFQALAEFDPDVIHIHGYRSYQSESSIDYGMKTGTPVVISMHGSAVAYRHLSMGQISRFQYSLYDKARGSALLRRVGAVVVNSTQEEAETKKYFPELAGKVTRLPVGTIIPVIPRKETYGESLLLVSRMSMDRDPRVIIRAVAQLKKEFPGLTLTLVGAEATLSSAVGGGILRRSSLLIDELDLGDSINVRGELARIQLEENYRSSDVFVYTSRYENFGLPVLEAAAFGLPVVTAKTGIATDLIADGTDGFLIDNAMDSGAYSARIRQLLNNRNLCREFGTRIRKKVVEEHDWNKAVDHYIELYSRSIENMTRRHPDPSDQRSPVSEPH